VVERSRGLLGIPGDYRIAIMPGSDTGAMEAAMWSLLGARGVDVLAWDKFGQDWATDVVEQLEVADARVFRAPYGALPDLSQWTPDRDVVFTWTGTSAGTCVPDGDWIPPDREGLAICDATAAVFAVDLPWRNLDVATYSWQKVMGGEAQHGMLILSPRAVARLESFTPPRPVPKLFRLTRDGRLDEEIFRASTINTPSMLCVEDALASLRWIEDVGGLGAMIERARRNRAVLDAWIAQTDWVDHLPEDPATRAPTPVCMRLAGPFFGSLGPGELEAAAARIPALLEAEEAAYDVGAHETAPPGLRVWTGGMVETADLEALLPWLDWAFEEVRGAAARRA
jgi:phosphoserine aminotransferase